MQATTQAFEYTQYLKKNLRNASRFNFDNGQEEPDRKKAEEFFRRSYDNLIALEVLVGESDSYRKFYTKRNLSINAKEISDLCDGERSDEWLRLSIEHALSARESYQDYQSYETPEGEMKRNYAFFLGFAAKTIETYILRTDMFFKSKINQKIESLFALSIDLDMECAKLTEEYNYRHSSITLVNAGRKATYLFTLTGKETYRKKALLCLSTFRNRYEEEMKMFKDPNNTIQKKEFGLLGLKNLYKTIKKNINRLVNREIKKGTDIKYFPVKNKD